jgi:glutathione gamma-glutamylcysteinyltransferase
LGQSGDGHFCPIGGLADDHVLLLDTARFKYPPHWAKLDSLFDAINTVDSVSGQKRGFLLLS